MAAADSSGLVKNVGTAVGVLLFVGLVAWGPFGVGEIVTRAVAPKPTPTVSVPTMRPSSPQELVIPRLKVSARVVSVELSGDLTLQPPRSPSLVGWWTGSARPGVARGGTVIAGHTVHTGGGALDALPTLRVGDRVDVRTRVGTMRYRVDEVVTYHKDQVAREASEIFGQDRSARLVVVTCDEWDGTSYLSNVVAYATPVQAIPVAKKAA